MLPYVYLAGPDVFLPNAAAWLERKRALCVRAGLSAATPFDTVPSEPAAWAGLPEAERIARRNEAHIRASAGVLANLTPFRGPSADAGTIYEVGFARGLGLPVFGYTDGTEGFAARTAAAWGGERAGWDRDGMQIEDFGLIDNLMIDCGVRDGGALVVGGEDAFARCVALAAAVLLRGGVG